MNKLILNPEFNLAEGIPKESQDGGYVYIVDLGDRIKIGKSKNVKRRFKEIQQLSGRKIKRFCVSPECGNYHEIERNLHSRFKELLILGEWFNLEFETAVSELNRYSFSTPTDSIECVDNFDIEIAANNHLKTVLDENPVIKKYLEENGLVIFYCKDLNEILISDGDGYDIEFSVFMQMYIAAQRAG